MLGAYCMIANIFHFEQDDNAVMTEKSLSRKSHNTSRYVLLNPLANNFHRLERSDNSKCCSGLATAVPRNQVASHDGISLPHLDLG